MIHLTWDLKYNQQTNFKMRRDEKLCCVQDLKEIETLFLRCSKNIFRHSDLLLFI